MQISQTMAKENSKKGILDSSPFWPILTIGLSILIILLLVLPGIHRPLIMDEMEFPAVAQALVHTGRPVYYRGELLPAMVGLWHPPLYIISYSLWFTILGDSIAASRLFGVFNLSLALIIIGWFSIYRWQRETIAGINRWTFLATIPLLGGLLVAATSPILVQGATLPDIDTQLLPLAVVAFFVLLFETRRCGIAGIRYWLVCTIGIALLLAAKLTVLPLLVVSLVVYELTSSNGIGSYIRVRARWRGFHKRLLRISATIDSELLRTILLPIWVLAAALVALAIVAIWVNVMSVIWQVDPMFPFRYLTWSTANPLTYAGSQGIFAVILSELPVNFLYMRQWIGLPLVWFTILLLVREFLPSLGGILSRSERLTLLAFVVALGIMYLILRPAPFHFPKYWPPLIPILALLTADWLYAIVRSGQHMLALAFGGAVFGLYVAYAALHPSMQGVDFILQAYTVWPKEELYNRWQNHPLVVAVILSIAVGVLQRQRVVPLIGVAILAVALGWQSTVVARQAEQTYSTTYYYGEQSLNDVAAYLEKHLPENAIVIMPKDLGTILYPRLRYIELKFDPRPTFDYPGVLALVMRTNDGYGNTIRGTPEIASELANRFDLDANIGNFSVFLRKP